jgi:hypothetical protein
MGAEVRVCCGDLAATVLAHGVWPLAHVMFVVGCVQEPLMAYASRAVAVMEAHRTVAGVVQIGLWLLASLSMAESNRVSGSDVVDTLVIVVRIERGREEWKQVRGEDGRQTWELKSAAAVVPGSMRSRSWGVVACMRDVCWSLWCRSR